MANNDSATPITTGSVTGKPKERGIYYFKLGSEYFLYDEDEQRLCGLTGAEIDSNFHFLSGYDIKDVQFNHSAGTVVITRVNEEDFSAMTLNLTEVRPELHFDKETGTLTMTYPDGEEKTADGFFVDFNDEGKYNTKVYTDGTLDGLGSMYKPLSLSRLERTGHFAPVETLIEGPITDECIGHRVLTREPVNDYGDLYAYPGLKAIQDALDAENSPWRVPTKADWDEMLNAMEETAKDHDENSTGYKGESAGCLLKSTKYWDYGQNANVNHEEHEYVGLNILPVGYAAAGRGTTMNAEDFDVEEFGKNAGFWTRNTEENEEAWVKVFGAGFDSVRQYREETEDMGTLYSIRLIKECEPGCPEQYETILGDSYPVGPIVGCYGDYCKIWTLSNFYGKVGSGVTLNADEPHYAYFINECDGRKKRMMEGESIVILDSGINPDLHEYRIIDGELVDTYDEIYETIRAKEENLYATINELSAGTESAISELSANTESAISELSANTDNAISELSANTETAISNLSANTEAAISELSANTESAISSLSSATVSEFENVRSEIDRLYASSMDAIHSLSANTEESIASLRSDLESEIRTVSEDLSTTKDDLQTEIERATSKENELSNGISSLNSSLDEFKEYTEDALDDNATAISNETIRAMIEEETLSGLAVSNRTMIEELSSEASANDERLDSRITELSGVVESFHSESVEEMHAISSNISSNVSRIDLEAANTVASLNTLSSSTIGISNTLAETISEMYNSDDEILSSLSATAESVLQEAKDYADEKANEINSVKVNDLYFDSLSKYIKLIKADGTLTEGISAEDFLKDRVLTSVEYDEGNERLIFVWNDDYTTRTYIPLAKLSNVYGVNDDSLAFLKISGTSVSAIVDKANGFEKTLATTKYADDKANEAVSAATEISARGLDNALTTLYDTIAEEHEDIIGLINDNSAEINKLNGDKTVPGSVNHTINDKFNTTLLTAGLPVTNVSVEDASNHSLLRAIIIDGETKYFVSNNAKDMLATDKDGYTLGLNHYLVSLENKIATLEAENTLLKDRVSLLERRVDDIAHTGVDETGIKEIIKNYLKGTEREIKLSESGDNLVIGFEDNAVFGELE